MKEKIIIFFRGIYLLFYIVIVFIGIAIKAGWYWVFNKRKYYELMRELDRL